MQNKHHFFSLNFGPTSGEHTSGVSPVIFSFVTLECGTGEWQKRVTLEGDTRKWQRRVSPEINTREKKLERDSGENTREHSGDHSEITQRTCQSAPTSLGRAKSYFLNSSKRRDHESKKQQHGSIFPLAMFLVYFELPYLLFKPFQRTKTTSMRSRIKLLHKQKRKRAKEQYSSMSLLDQAHQQGGSLWWSRILFFHLICSSQGMRRRHEGWRPLMDQGPGDPLWDICKQSSQHAPSLI